MTIALLPLLLLSPAHSARAAEHRVEVRASYGKKAYVQAIELAEGSQANYVGPVGPAGGGPSKEMIFNALLTRDEGAAGAYLLQYQLEVSEGDRKPGRSLQVQSQLALRPGDRLLAVECGPWSVELDMDPSKGMKRTVSWDPPGHANYRLTGNVTAGPSKQSYKNVFKMGTQSNVVDSLLKGGKKYGFIFNSLVSPVQGEGFTLQYQVQQSLTGGRPLQLQNETTLPLGKRKTLPGQGYSLELLLEGPAPSKRAASGKRPAADEAAVPLMR